MPIVAGFDLASTSGCAILDGTKVVHIESHRPIGKDDPELFRNFRTWFRAMLVAHEVQEVAIEQPLVTNIAAPDTRPNARPGQTHNPVTMKTYLRLYGLRAHAVEICEALNIPCRELHQSTWRKAFTGNGRATKEETLALAKRICPGLKSKDAAEALGVAWALNGELSKIDLFAGAA
jgi:Holliday junction resolvasome RuvABC endonuclease subunit